MIRKPTPEELFERMLTPFDEEIDPVLAMTPEEIRASLAADGYNVAAIEREARAFLGLKQPKRPRLILLASVIAPFALVGGLAQTFAAPVLPMAARAPSDPPAITGAAPPPVSDGGFR